MGTVINSTSKNLRAYRDEILEEIKNLVADTATDIEIAATRGAPKFISIDKRFLDKGLTAEVGVMGDNEMAAYIEFGTGLSAKEILKDYPDWIKDIAWQFYINGKGTLTGKPYLYNNFLIKTKDFEKDLNKLLKNEPINDN